MHARQIAIRMRDRAALIASFVMPLAAAQAAPAVVGGDLSALLKSQTQASSEAGQRGDAVALGRYLDPELVFTNESGEVGGRQDVLDSTTPPQPGGPKRRIEVTEWVLRAQGPDIATASFVDQVTSDVAGQSLVLKFRSTETWARRADGWKMIASHTMNVLRPPAAITLPGPQLDEYCGVYRLGSVYTVKIVRDGTGLSASVNNGPPAPLLVEMKDDLFTPGTPNVRRIFQRDATGRIAGYINRRDGADLVFTRAK